MAAQSGFWARGVCPGAWDDPWDQGAAPEGDPGAASGWRGKMRACKGGAGGARKEPHAALKGPMEKWFKL